MKKLIHIFISIFLLIISAVAYVIFQLGGGFSKDNPEDQFLLELAASSMQISSPDFEEGSLIPQEFTCDGSNINPTLYINQIPEGTKKLALVVSDLDAPNKSWVHWLVYNIPINTSVIEKNTVPSGATEGQNDFGKTTYQGPCPPSGTHRYVFQLLALSSDKNLPANLRLDVFEKSIQSITIAQAQLVGMFER